MWEMVCGTIVFCRAGPMLVRAGQVACAFGCHLARLRSRHNFLAILLSTLLTHPKSPYTVRTQSPCKGLRNTPKEDHRENATDHDEHKASQCGTLCRRALVCEGTSFADQPAVIRHPQPVVHGLRERGYTAAGRGQRVAAHLQALSPRGPASERTPGFFHFYQPRISLAAEASTRRSIRHRVPTGNAVAL